MRNTKRELPLFSMYDHTGMERHLEEMAVQGWMLEKTTGFGWVYRRCEARRVRYAVTYFPKASAYEPGPSEDKQIFQDYCAQAGWELVSDAAQRQIFRTEAENPLPIETDAAIQVDNIHRAMKRSFLPSHFALMAVSLLWAGLLGWRLMTDPIGLLSSNSNLFTAFCWTIVLALSLLEVGGYFLWHRRAKAAAMRDGSFTPTRSHRRLQAVMLVVVLMALAVWLLASALDSGRTLAFALAGLLHVMILVALVNLLTRFLKRRKVSARTNRTVTLVSAVVLSSLSLVLMGYGIFRMIDHGWFGEHQGADTYTFHGLTWDVYRDPLPLTVEDLMDIDTSDSYSYEWRDDSSVLLANLEATQHARLDVPEPIPELDYQIILVKLPLFYSLCRDSFLSRAARHNDQMPPEYWDEYRLTDFPAWDAQSVYQLYRAGEPCDRYLVCWPDRILQIDFNWTPTAKQAALAAEKLRAI